MKTIIIFAVIILTIGVWFFLTKSSAPESDIISRNGLHWHSNLAINILGENQDIPGGIGLEKLPHKPLHTHDSDSVIHMEYSGLITKTDLRLGNFFKVWGKKFNKDCIFEKCSGPEGQLKMLVNGKENGDFEDYVMQDSDKIEIIFEAQPKANVVSREITVTGTEFVFNPSIITLTAGEKVKLTFKNNGGVPHNLVIEGLGVSTKTIGGGKTDTIEFIAPAGGNYPISCSIPGHKEAGMQGTLRVE